MKSAEQQVAYGRLGYLKKIDKHLSNGVSQADALKMVGIPRSKYYRWKKLHAKSGVEGLTPDYSARRAGQCKASEEQEAWIRKMMGHQNRPHARTLYNTQFIFFCASLDQEPVSYSTFIRIWNRTSEAYRSFYCEGPKAYADGNPWTPRALDILDFGQMINSDHMQWDSMVRLADGKMCFPWLTWWMDMRTGKALGWVLSESPNQDIIAEALYKTITQYGLRTIDGRVQMIAYIDNGKDYSCRQYMGMTYEGRTITKRMKIDLDTVWVRGTYASLGIDVKFAREYNARSKPAESAHRTLHNLERADLRNFYRGTGPEHRPEYMKGKIAGGQEIDPAKVPTMEEFKIRVTEYLAQYDTLVNDRLGMSPRDCYNKLTPRCEYQFYPDWKLEILMAKLWHNKPMKVATNGIRISRRIKTDEGKRTLEGWYYHDGLVELTSQFVLVKYNPIICQADELPQELFIYSINGDYLFPAQLKTKAHPFKAGREMFENNRHQKKLRDLLKNSQRAADEAVLKGRELAHHTILQDIYNNDMSGLPDA